MRRAIGVLCVGMMACSGVARGADTRDLDTITIAQPTIAGRDVGESCGWDDDPCRADLVCDERRWTCALPDPLPAVDCTDDAQCPWIEPSCNRGRCAVLGSERDSCGSDSNCLPELRCSASGSCRSRLGP